MKKWGFLGCGNLAQAIITGALQKKIILPSSVLISNRTLAKSKKFSHKTKVKIARDNSNLIKNSDIIVIGTKPTDMIDVLKILQSSNLKNKTVISLGAGVESAVLKKFCGEARAIFRVMANTPVQIQKGFFGIYPIKVSKNDKEFVFKFFKSLGHPTFVKDDQHMTAITAGSASGVGFVFWFIETFEKWFCSKGLTPDQAREAAVTTFLGAAQLAQKQSHLKLSELLSQVTSKNGTTFAGLEAFKQKKVGAGLKSGLDAAFKRSQHIAKSLRQNQK